MFLRPYSTFMILLPFTGFNVDLGISELHCNLCQEPQEVHLR